MRDWRYHKTMKAWLTRSACGGMKEQTTEYEKGLYHVFDPTRWRKISQEMTLEYKDLEQRPTSELKKQTTFKSMYSAVTRSNPQSPINGFDFTSKMIEKEGKEAGFQDLGRQCGLNHPPQAGLQKLNIHVQSSRDVNESKTHLSNRSV